MSELTDRLRKDAAMNLQHSGKLELEAADALEAQQAEIDDAKAAAAFFVRDEANITPRQALVRQAAEIERLRSQLARAREALEQSVLALEDWLHTYAPDECGKDDVARTVSRIWNRGGTLAYIAEVQHANRQALG